MDIPLACNISAIKAEERSLHKKNAEDIFGSVKEVKELSGGYAFQLPAKTKLINKPELLSPESGSVVPSFISH